MNNYKIKPIYKSYFVCEYNFTCLSYPKKCKNCKHNQTKDYFEPKKK